MPNICKNILTVYGPADLVDVFVDLAHGPTHDFKPDKHDIAMEQRRREHCLATGQTFVSDAERAVQPVDLSFHRLVPLPAEVLARGYGFDVDGKDGDAWERERWGIKWGASESKCTRHVPAQPDGYALAEYTFTTPWRPPTVWLRRVAWDDRWWRPTTGLPRDAPSPSLAFALSWGEEDCNRGRELTMQRMIRLELSEHATDRDSARFGDFDANEDAYFARRDAYVHHYIATHHAWLDELGWT